MRRCKRTSAGNLQRFNAPEARLTAMRPRQYYFVTGDPPRTEGWSVNVLHATAFLTESDAEAAIMVYKIADARGCQQIYDFWYVFK